MGVSLTEEKNVLKSVFCVSVFVALVSPAFANEYWVEYNYSTHECSIVMKESPETPPAVAAFEPPKDPSTVDRVVAPIVVQRPPQDGPEIANGAAPADTPTNGTANDAPSADTPTNGTADGVDPTGGPTDGAANDAAPAGAPAVTAKGPAKDPTAALAATWARKKAAAEAAGTADITTGLIGSALRSREEAESEMRIMRKCGIAN